ncbi:SIS domain-containing protein [Bacillus horti]|nr:SIS domain-containing protein [Bacillus horti]
MIKEYFNHIHTGLETILKEEAEKIKEAAQTIAQTVANKGLIYVFGCGHSHMIAEEIFYRAGGLAPVNPIFTESLMLHEGAVRSSTLEKMAGYGEHVLNEHRLSSADILIVVSTSGRNPVPIDVAITAQKAGCFVVALTSFHYTKLQSRHQSGKHLSDYADLAINNHVVLGDAVMEHERVTVPFAPVSTIYNMVLINSIVAQAIAYIAENGDQPPIFLSGNLDHSEEHNLQLITAYKDKIPLLK